MRGLIELFVVAVFAIGYGVIELVALRYDKHRVESGVDKSKGQDTE